MEPIIGFFHKWPRNFAISLGVELLVAQPIARFVMLKYHTYFDSKKTDTPCPVLAKKPQKCNDTL